MNWISRLLGRRNLPALTPELSRRIRDSFDQAAADEENFPSTIDPRILHVQLLLREFGDLAGRRVLDCGCGKGRFARILKERHPDATLVGMDLSETMLRYVPEGIARCSASMTSLPFATDAFDGVYATESLEHAVDVEGAVAELCRVLKPGGRLIIIDKNQKQWGRLETPEWETWFTQAGLERLLKRHCREVSSQPLSYWEDVEPDGLILAWVATK